MKEKMERDERKMFFSKMFQDPRTRQMNKPKMFRDELFLHSSSKVQNLTVFSIIYMIRIRFFGPGESVQIRFRVGSAERKRPYGSTTLLSIRDICRWQYQNPQSAFHNVTAVVGAVTFWEVDDCGHPS